MNNDPKSYNAFIPVTEYDKFLTFQDTFNISKIGSYYRYHYTLNGKLCYLLSIEIGDEDLVVMKLSLGSGATFISTPK